MSTNNNIILKKIEQGEGQHLDFKHSINDSRKIARSLSAFANTDGGVLLIGVKDNGSVKGIRSDEEYYMVETAAHIFCKPELKFNHKLWNVSGKNVLEIIVDEGKDKPYYAPDEKGDYKAFVRNNDQNLIAEKIMKEVWKRKKKGVKGVKLIFNHVAKTLIEQIENKGSISKPEFIKLTGIKTYIADNILINLILMNILEFRLSEKSTRYAFTKEFLNNEKYIDFRFIKK